MAGKRQHYIWQMLQRGFSFKERNDDHIWVYRKGVEPERTVTRKFGQSNKFYGAEGSEADNNITRFENATQSFITDARKMDNGQSVDGNISAALVAHLEMRSLFIRDEMSRLGERIISSFQDYMASPKQRQALMRAYINNHPELLDAEMDKANIDNAIRPLIREIFMQNAPELIRKSASEENYLLDSILDQLIANMSEVAKNAHNESLLSDFSEIKRSQSHRSLVFSILRSPDSDFILPDTSLAFFTRTGCTPVSDKNDRVEAVVVPLSVDVAIIGKRDSLFKREMPTIQRALASCSYEAFISPRRGDDLINLSNRISKNARLLTESEIRSIIRFDNLLKI